MVFLILLGERCCCSSRYGISRYSIERESLVRDAMMHFKNNEESRNNTCSKTLVNIEKKKDLNTLSILDSSMFHILRRMHCVKRNEGKENKKDTKTVKRRGMRNRKKNAKRQKEKSAKHKDVETENEMRKSGRNKKEDTDVVTEIAKKCIKHIKNNFIQK